MSNFKIVLLGEGCVGKSSLVLRYCQNTFNENHVTTIQASFLTKRLNIAGKRANLAIWDTAGQERFHALGPIYYRDANGALLVYDITDRDSFIRVRSWVKELRKMLGSNITLAIAGNKCDLEKSRVVSLEEAEKYASTVGAKHYSTSAKLNKGLEELFLDLARRMIAKRGASGSSAGGLMIADEDDLDDDPYSPNGASNNRYNNNNNRGNGNALVISNDEPPPVRDQDGCAC